MRGQSRKAEKGQEQSQRKAGEQASAEQCLGNVVGDEGDHMTKLFWFFCGGES